MCGRREHEEHLKGARCVRTLFIHFRATVASLTLPTILFGRQAVRARMASGNRLRMRPLNFVCLTLVALLTSSSPIESQAGARRPAASTRPLWTFDTGG